uniref:Putative secreted protein n=1 Tax=Panstrongylus lignarius TaxID=156445 RepID=A0A224Y4K8_9HEMI
MAATSLISLSFCSSLVASLSRVFKTESSSCSLSLLSSKTSSSESSSNSASSPSPSFSSNSTSSSTNLQSSFLSLVPFLRIPFS